VALFHDGDRRVGSDYVVSWVPTSLVEVAARGIDVNPEGCIAWLSDSATHVAEVLRAKELIGSYVVGWAHADKVLQPG
jgi:hypothetical protein